MSGFTDQVRAALETDHPYIYEADRYSGPNGVCADAKGQAVQGDPRVAIYLWDGSEDKGRVVHLDEDQTLEFIKQLCVSLANVSAMRAAAAE